MFEQAFRNIDDALRKEAGCATELDYAEQTSWLLFLKYLDGLEQDKAAEAALEGRAYTPILEKPYRWESWAAPKDKHGNLDHHKALSGDDLRGFVDRKLFPYLHGFKSRAEGAATIEYKIGEIFGELTNKIRSGYILRDIIDQVDGLRFRSQVEKHELSALYEEKIKRMGNAGRNGGEYYTPRPLIRAIIRVVNPKLGETIYDGACGSAGFLCEAFDYLRQGKRPSTGSVTSLTTRDMATLQTRTFYGKEKKSLAYVIGIMNLILHGIEAPNLVHTNTLAENLADIQEKDRHHVVLANPPFGGKERPEVQQNFPIRTGETAFLFLQHFIKILKAGDLFASHLQAVFSQRAATPMGWHNTTLAELATIQSGAGFPTKFQGKVRGGIPFYKVSDMNIPGNETEMVHENNSVTEQVRQALGAAVFPRGSVIFPKIGGAIATNKKRLTTCDCCVDNNVMGAIPKTERMRSRFLFFFFSAYKLSDFANDAHLPSIKKSTLEEWAVCVPRSLVDQDDIAAQLDALSAETQRLAGVYARQSAALAELKQALLHRAFAGEL